VPGKRKKLPNPFGKRKESAAKKEREKGGKEWSRSCLQCSERALKESMNTTRPCILGADSDHDRPLRWTLGKQRNVTS